MSSQIFSSDLDRRYINQVVLEQAEREFDWLSTQHSKAVDLDEKLISVSTLSVFISILSNAKSASCSSKRFLIAGIILLCLSVAIALIDIFIKHVSPLQNPGVLLSKLEEQPSQNYIDEVFSQFLKSYANKLESFKGQHKNRMRRIKCGYTVYAIAFVVLLIGFFLQF